MSWHCSNIWFLLKSYWIRNAFHLIWSHSQEYTLTHFYISAFLCLAVFFFIQFIPHSHITPKTFHLFTHHHKIQIYSFFIDSVSRLNIEIGWNCKFTFFCYDWMLVVWIKQHWSAKWLLCSVNLLKKKYPKKKCTLFSHQLTIATIHKICINNVQFYVKYDFAGWEKKKEKHAYEYRFISIWMFENNGIIQFFISTKINFLFEMKSNFKSLNFRFNFARILI